MPVTSAPGSGMNAELFDRAFGSLSVSSNDWANFDDSPTSGAMPLQQQLQSHNTSAASSGSNSKPFVMTLASGGNFAPVGHTSSNGNDSSTSSAPVNALFNASGAYSQLTVR